MATVCLIGTLDTKHDEYSWIANEIEARGAEVLLMDVGGYSESPLATIRARDVAEAAGADLAQLREQRNRGEMIAAMAKGAAIIAERLVRERRIHAIFAVGGSGGSSVAARAMQAVPVGFPKLLVSTMASGDVSPYVGEVDMTLMYSVVDIAGINSVSELVLGNAAAAAAGMAKRFQEHPDAEPADRKPVVAVSMFGVTTPAANEARARLDELGYEVLVFHATGSGGRAMEKLAESGFLAGVLDLTTTELADELVGGVLSAGPRRLEAAGRAGIPQVVSVGALDMVNFGPRETVPLRFAGRNFFVHNPNVTLMRTTTEEMKALGVILAEKLADSTGPAAVFLPLKGVSAIDVEGGPFHDPAADGELFSQIRTGLSGTSVEVVDLDSTINNAGFGRAMADRLHQLITT